MSKPRYPWWSYAKAMVKMYPQLSNGVSQLPPARQREYEAVRQAIAATERMTAGRDRLRVIDLVFWKQSQDLEHAALIIPCSYRTARRYHSDFIRLVGFCYGLEDVTEGEANGLEIRSNRQAATV